jgi:hypothetical protein
MRLAEPLMRRRTRSAVTRLRARAGCRPGVERDEAAVRRDPHCGDDHGSVKTNEWSSPPAPAGPLGRLIRRSSSTAACNGHCRGDERDEHDDSRRPETAPDSAGAHCHRLLGAAATWCGGVNTKRGATGAPRGSADSTSARAQCNRPAQRSSARGKGQPPRVVGARSAPLGRVRDASADRAASRSRDRL